MDPSHKGRSNTKGAETEDMEHAVAVDAAQKQTFLQALSEGRSVRQAAEAAGVAPEVPYGWRAGDDAFVSAWKIAEEAGTDIIEEEAFRRAVNGVQKPVYRSGEVVGHVADYSDTMLMFLLKARRPDRYGSGAAGKGASKTAGHSTGADGDDPLNLKGTRDALISKFLAVHEPGETPTVSK